MLNELHREADEELSKRFEENGGYLTVNDYFEVTGLGPNYVPWGNYVGINDPSAIAALHNVAKSVVI